MERIPRPCFVHVPPGALSSLYVIKRSEWGVVEREVWMIEDTQATSVCCILIMSSKCFNPKLETTSTSHQLSYNQKATTPDMYTRTGYSLHKPTTPSHHDWYHIIL